MKKILLFALILFCALNSKAQLSWHLLNSSPAERFRHDDLWFINVDTGWVVNVSGQIWKTQDGGNTWRQLLTAHTSYRCVSFFDSIHGCIGNLGPGRWAATSDTNPLYKTNDGGNTVILPTIIGPRPKGICGLCKVNDTVIVGCGRVDGPAFYVRSTDGGNTWISKDMSPYAGMLVDIYFTSPDTGFVVGGDDSTDAASHSLILYTTDGGNTWTTKIKGVAQGDHCWKFSHTPDKFYYVSVEEQTAADTLKFFKSTDAGATWTENIVDTVQYGFSQGIGFANDTLGWIGGATQALTTSNGGRSFTNFNPALLINMNRIRFINDTIAYAVGQRVYKYYNPGPSIVPQYVNFAGYSLEQNVPNPFSKLTSITYSVPVTTEVSIGVYDNAGREVKTLVNENKSPGTYTVKFSLPQPCNGHFVCSMLAGLYGKSIHMISVKQ